MVEMPFPLASLVDPHRALAGLPSDSHANPQAVDLPDNYTRSPPAFGIPNPDHGTAFLGARTGPTAPHRVVAARDDRARGPLCLLGERLRQAEGDPVGVDGAGRAEEAARAESGRDRHPGRRPDREGGAPRVGPEEALHRAPLRRLPRGAGPMSAIGKTEFAELITEAWRCQAPRALVQKSGR